MAYEQLDHEAIWKAYPNIVNSCDTFVNYGLDKDGNKVYWEPVSYTHLTLPTSG